MRVREANEVLGQIKSPDDGYRALAAAIIAKACDDYIRAVQHGDDLRIQSVEHFLLSERFMLYSQGVEGGYILRKLKDMSPKYDEHIEAKPVQRYNAYGKFVAEYPSLAEAARSVGGVRSTIRRAISSGKLVFGSYWGFA